MSSKKPKLGTAIKKVTEAIGIETCLSCEGRAFAMDRWTHKKPIRKVDVLDCEMWNKERPISLTISLYLKYFGLDNTNTKSEKVMHVMESDLNKLFNDGEN
jgi:hypothetical protein